jgi:hypothetical protein
MNRVYLLAGLLALTTALAAPPVTQFNRGGSSSGQLVIATNSLQAVTKTGTYLVNVSGWFGSAALVFSGVYPAAVTNDVIVTLDASFDSNVWKNAWLVWTNSVQGTTTNRTTATVNLDGIGFLRATITNTAAGTTCNAVSLWAQYSPKRF